MIQLEIDSEENFSPNFTLVNHKEGNSHRMTLGEAVEEGLTKSTGMKTLPCQFLYDERGSQLFEEITYLDEYYVTRCEHALLQRYSKEIFDSVAGNETILVELGSGSSRKTRTLLDEAIAQQGNVHYVPIDISKSILFESSKKLLSDYSHLKITANNGLYQQGLAYLGTNYSNKNKLVCFLGGSIGNFDKSEAVKFLEELQLLLQPTDRFLIGIDLRKSKEVLEPAYDDSKGVTSEFNLNLIDRINSELGANFDRNQFQHVARYIEDEGRMDITLLSRVKQSAFIKDLNLSIELEANESIHTEDSHKYSFAEIETLAYSSGFKTANVWTDGMFALCLFEPLRREVIPKTIETKLESAWKFSDRIFALLREDGYLQRPIQLRHPFLFYLGHLPAFANNHVMNFLLQEPSINAYFDEIFERGIDPNADDPDQCHPHSVIPSQWPSIKDVVNFRTQVRKRVMESIPKALSSKSFMAQKGRVFHMVAEHNLMHAETLLYMYLNLDVRYKNVPSPETKNYIIAKSPVPKGKMIEISGGSVTLGSHLHEIPWGWDCEFPQKEVEVPSFLIDELPVTNGEFFEFVLSGEYRNPIHWTVANWEWKEKVKLNHPNCWRQAGDKWFYRTVTEEIPLVDVFDWPVYVSHAEASAFASWKGKRLPREEELMRAALGTPTPSSNKRKFPWGSAEPVGGIHGNFDLFSMAPTPVGYFPEGKSAFGVFELWGNGWEWTSTVFEGFPGFDPFVPNYSGYSKDFFDGLHYVMLGASWATEKSLLRRSFRNWFQSHYQHTFTKFRCATD